MTSRVAAIAIVGLLAIIVGLLAYPYVHDARVRGSLGYRSASSECRLWDILGNRRVADDCQGRVDRRHGLR